MEINPESSNDSGFSFLAQAWNYLLMSNRSKHPANDLSLYLVIRLDFSVDQPDI